MLYTRERNALLRRKVRGAVVIGKIRKKHFQLLKGFMIDAEV